MNKVTSILEILDSDNTALETRSHLTENVTGIGPPDICIVLREHQPTGIKKLISKPYLKSYYHHVYGVDSSSLASIAAYFKHFLDSYNKTLTKTRVLSAYFCSFDLFSKFDLQVEMRIPGNLTAFITNKAGNKFVPQEVHWHGAYLSSFLRSCYPVASPATAYVEQFKTIQDFEKLFLIGSLFWDQLGFVLGDLRDTKKYGKNLLFPAISKYLLKRRRYKVHQAIIRNLVGLDPLMLCFLALSSMQIGRVDEIIQLLGNQIKITPHAFPLYYTIAKAYLKRGDTTQALAVTQYLIELNLEVFEYWELLVLCYIKSKDIKSALLTFNQLPHYTIEPETYKNVLENPQIIKSEKISFAALSTIWTTPSELDFKPFEEYDYGKTKKERNLISILDSLPGSSLKDSKKRAYKLLAKIEKSIEWSTLLKLNKETFVSSSPSKQMHFSNFSSIGEKNRSGFTRSFQVSSHDNNPVLDSETGPNIQPVQMLTCRDYFLSESKQNRLSSLMNQTVRVQNESTLELLNTMNGDLKVIYEWQKESSDIHAVHSVQSNKNPIEEIPFSGDLWIRRGVLSERLLRNKQAERAYRYTVEKGFSLFAWYRLMKIYVRAGNPKAVLVCIAELMKQVESEAVVFEGVPPWIEEILGKLCQGCGFKHVYSLAGELKMKNLPALQSCIEKLRYWKTDGVQDS